MLKLRLEFEKRGPAAFISHLDTMQVFRRAFTRAGIALRFTEGFNPHPYLSIALPLPTCFESTCELLDTDLDADHIPTGLVMKLNRALPEGIVVRKAYEVQRPAKGIAYAAYTVQLPVQIPADLLHALFSSPELVVMLHTKSGDKETDIRPRIHQITFTENEEGTVLHAVLVAGAVSLNPEYLVKAISRYIQPVPYCSCCRAEIFDQNLAVFR